MAYLWICYVDFKMFESYERLRRLYLIAAIPVMAICVLLVVNLFVELFFGVIPGKCLLSRRTGLAALCGGLWLHDKRCSAGVPPSQTDQ